MLVQTYASSVIEKTTVLNLNLLLFLLKTTKTNFLYSCSFVSSGWVFYFLHRQVKPCDCVTSLKGFARPSCWYGTYSSTSIDFKHVIPALQSSMRRCTVLWAKKQGWFKANWWCGAISPSVRRHQTPCSFSRDHYVFRNDNLIAARPVQYLSDILRKIQSTFRSMQLLICNHCPFRRGERADPFYMNDKRDRLLNGDGRRLIAVLGTAYRAQRSLHIRTAVSHCSYAV